MLAVSVRKTLCSALAGCVLMLGAASELAAQEQESAPPAGAAGSAPELGRAPGPDIVIAPAPVLQLKYDVYYSLLRMVTIESRSRVERDVYNVESRMETVGLIGTFFPWSYRSEVHGRVDGQDLRPDVFSSHSEIRDRVQQVSLRYDASGPTIADVTPFDGAILGQGEDYTRDEVTPELRAGTIDPLTEVASMSQQLARGEGCAGVRSVFDGLRRYDVIYEDLGETELADSSYDAYEGRARQCRSRLQPIAGFWKPKEEKGESVTSITAWLMPPVPGADAVPVRIEVEGARGTLSIHLTKVAIS